LKTLAFSLAAAALSNSKSSKPRSDIVESLGPPLDNSLRAAFLRDLPVSWLQPLTPLEKLEEATPAPPPGQPSFQAPKKPIFETSVADDTPYLAFLEPTAGLIEQHLSRCSGGEPCLGRAGSRLEKLPHS
jgi:hypothetical protein